jgi:DNA-binding beta-propeller fold protein YncE
MNTTARVLGFALLGPFGIACTERSPVAPADVLVAQTSASRDRCDSPRMTAVLEFDNQGTAEGVAVSQKGDVFVGTGSNVFEGNGTSGKAEIWRAPKGDFRRGSLLTRLPGGHLIGIDVDRHGNVYAALAAFLASDLHGLWKVQPDGTAERVGALPAFFSSLPNDVTLDPRGNVYVSDSFAGKIWRLTPEGEFSVWVQDELLRAFFGDFEFGVNGLVYAKRALYAAITQNGRVITIPIQPDGAAGTPAILVQDDALIGIDGIEPDVRGNLYVTNNFASTIQLIRADDLGIETITGEGLSAPASLAFNKNQKVLYVANLSTSAGFPQPYAPALVQVNFSAPVVACASRNCRGCG